MKLLPLKFQKELKKLGVLTVYLFGSRASGHAGPQSDFDLAVQLKYGISQSRTFDLRLILMQKFAQFFQDSRVEVIILNDAPPLLAMNVTDSGKILFEADHEERVALEVHIMNRYFDRLPYEERYYQDLIHCA